MYSQCTPKHIFQLLYLTGAPLGMFVSPFKEMSKEGAGIWLEDCRQRYKGIAGSNILFDVPDEALYIDAEGNYGNLGPYFRFDIFVQLILFLSL